MVLLCASPSLLPTVFSHQTQRNARPQATPTGICAPWRKDAESIAASVQLYCTALSPARATIQPQKVRTTMGQKRPCAADVSGRRWAMVLVCCVCVCGGAVGWGKGSMSVSPASWGGVARGGWGAGGGRTGVSVVFARSRRAARVATSLARPHPHAARAAHARSQGARPCARWDGGQTGHATHLGEGRKAGENGGVSVCGVIVFFSCTALPSRSLSPTPGYTHSTQSSTPQNPGRTRTHFPLSSPSIFCSFFLSITAHNPQHRPPTNSCCAAQWPAPPH